MRRIARHHTQSSSVQTSLYVSLYPVRLLLFISGPPVLILLVYRLQIYIDGLSIFGTDTRLIIDSAMDGQEEPARQSNKVHLERRSDLSFPSKSKNPILIPRRHERFKTIGDDDIDDVSCCPT